MSTLPPGSRTPFVLPDRPRPRALGIAENALAAIPYTPVPEGRPPTTPVIYSDPRFYLTANPFARAAVQERIFLPQFTTAGGGEGTQTYADQWTGIASINGVTGAPGPSFSIPDPSQWVSPSHSAGVLGIGVSLNYLYLMMWVVDDGVGGDLLHIYRTPVDGSGSWMLYTTGAEFSAYLPTARSFALDNWDVMRQPLANLGVDPATDVLWFPVSVPTLPDNPPDYYIIRKRNNLAPDLTVSPRDPSTTVLSIQPPFWYLGLDPSTLLVFAEGCTTLPLPDPAVHHPAVGDPVLENWYEESMQLTDTGQGHYLLILASEYDTDLAYSWTYAGGVWTPGADITSIGNPAARKSNNYLGSGPGGEPWNTVSLKSRRAAFLGGRAFDGTVTSSTPFTSIPDTIFGALPLYEGKPLINLDAYGEPGVLSSTPNPLAQWDVDRSSPLSVMLDGSLMVAGFAIPTPPPPTLYTTRYAANSGVLPSRVFSCDRDLQNFSGGLAPIMMLNLVTGSEVLWARSPSNRSVARWIGLAADESYVYLTGQQDPGNSAPYVPIVVRRSTAAPVGVQSPAGDASWEVYVTAADFATASGAIPSTYVLDLVTPYIDEVTGTLWVTLAHNDMSNGNRPISLFQKDPGQALIYHGLIVDQGAFFAGPNTTLCTVGVDMTTFTLHTSTGPVVVPMATFGLTSLQLKNAQVLPRLSVRAPGDYLAMLPRAQRLQGDIPDAFGTWGCRYHNGAWGPVATLTVDASNYLVVFNDGQLGFIPDPTLQYEQQVSWDGTTATIRLYPDATSGQLLFDGVPTVGEDPRGDSFGAIPTGAKVFRDGSILVSCSLWE